MPKTESNVLKLPINISLISLFIEVKTEYIVKKHYVLHTEYTSHCSNPTCLIFVKISLQIIYVSYKQ